MLKIFPLTSSCSLLAPLPQETWAEVGGRCSSAYCGLKISHGVWGS